MMRAFKDLREFLQLLEAEGQLLRIIEAVSLESNAVYRGASKCFVH
jgi:3-polyprenyl-4-hydroxybenzoate decarboxylase